MRKTMSKETQSHSDEFFIRAADSDAQWGPFLFVRPAPWQRFGSARAAALSILIGGAFGLPGSIFLALLARSAHRAVPPVYLFPLVLTIAYCCLCHLTIVPAWNRRARRLSKRNLPAGLPESR